METFNVERFLDDYDIPKFTEGKNCQPGWINIQCPFCDDDSNHGGFNLGQGYYNCWKCGGHNLDLVVKELLGIRKGQAQDVVDEYSERIKKKKAKKKQAKAQEIILPPGCGKMDNRHIRYLKKRYFDPGQLEQDWNLMGTREYGSYKFRIIAPIYRQGRLVSYQGRDITDKQKLRYKACAIENEVIHHKHILYGSDYVLHRKGIVLEGITDVWRMGKGSVGTFGSTYTKQQIQEIYRIMDYAFILYDPDAEDKADKMSWDLSMLGVEVEKIILYNIKDPALLNQREAERIRLDLIGY